MSDIQKIANAQRTADSQLVFTLGGKKASLKCLDFLLCQNSELAAWVGRPHVLLGVKGRAETVSEALRRVREQEYIQDLYRGHQVGVHTCSEYFLFVAGPYIHGEPSPSAFICLTRRPSPFLPIMQGGPLRGNLTRRHRSPIPCTCFLGP